MATKEVQKSVLYRVSFELSFKADYEAKDSRPLQSEKTVMMKPNATKEALQRALISFFANINEFSEDKVYVRVTEFAVDNE